jgi:hypothetical protein
MQEPIPEILIRTSTQSAGDGHPDWPTVRSALIPGRGDGPPPELRAASRASDAAMTAHPLVEPTNLEVL